MQALRKCTSSMVVGLLGIDDGDDGWADGWTDHDTTRGLTKHTTCITPCTNMYFFTLDCKVLALLSCLKFPTKDDDDASRSTPPASPARVGLGIRVQLTSTIDISSFYFSSHRRHGIHILKWHSIARRCHCQHLPTWNRAQSDHHLPTPCPSCIAHSP